MAAPNDYRHTYWKDLSLATEAKLGLPSGLLAAVVTKGERSNADSVSEAGAKTPFQIIPATRDAAIKKYGIDAYLSPENAAEVAGLLLKDSLSRNKGDTASAVAEYHGGTDRSNWGPRTRSYVNRVMVDQQRQKASTLEGESTFQRALAKQTPVNSDVIARVYQAYQAGRMTPEEASQFEADVNSGAVMLPQGATLAGQQASAVTKAIVLPREVTEAYVNGKMTEKERSDLEADMRAGIVKLAPTASSQIPGGDDWQAPTEQGIIQRAPEPSFGDKLIGAGEAALTTATGLTGGLAGMIGGTGVGMTQAILNGQFGTKEGADMVERSAMEGAQALTYAPRTDVGQEYVQNVGEVMQEAMPLAGLGAEIGALAGSTKAAQPAVTAMTRAAAAPVIAGAGRAAQIAQTAATRTVQAVKNAPGKAAEMVGLKQPDQTPTPGTIASGGAAGTDVSTMRRMAAQDLPVPVDLTKGQATRDFGQLRFEQEAAKNGELGAPIRERMSQQHRAVRQSFDAWIDETGAQAPDSRSVGITVDKALRAKAARDKVEIRLAYKEAEKAGETTQPVSLQAVVDALNESVSAESTAPVLVAARKELIRLGGASEGTDGLLVAKDMTLANTEQLRKFVNKTTGIDPTNVKFAGDIKRAIDASTEGAGGSLYKKARALRTEYADQYENHAVISDLLNNKRGLADRKVALEDVFDRVVFRGSLDDLQQAYKVLQTGGEEGVQAWKEIQGQAMRHIRDEATKNVARDTYGNEMISPAALDKAIRRLDNDGKLDYLFGKRGAEQMRAVNDLAKVLFTTPPGAVNTSNTASVLLGAMDMALSNSIGIPLPVPFTNALKQLLRNVKDRKLRARIQDALGKTVEQKK